MPPSASDDAASLIKRLVDATDKASHAPAHARAHAGTDSDSDECNRIIGEMKLFLSSGWECGKDCGFSGSYGACSIHEEEGCDHCNSKKGEELHVSIGSDDMLVLNVADDEIDLSAPSHTIGDAGCTALCNSLASISASRSLLMLDLEANGLNIGCNSIGGRSAIELAAALHCCPLLSSLDLHGNAIGDDGCVAIGEALAAGATPSLDLLDLSANRCEDRGCSALAPLFRGGAQSCCPLLTHLNLGENSIESSALLFSGATTLPSLRVLDLSWNSISNFGELRQALALHRSAIMCPSLVELNLKGNSLSDMGCLRLCSELMRSGAAPRLIPKESEVVYQGDEDCIVGEGRLRRSLQLLADGNANNSPVCCLALWDSSAVLGCMDPNADNRVESNDIQYPLELPNEMLRRDGFVVQPPIASALDVAHLAGIMDDIESAGWPPVFCFMNSKVWDFVTAKVWPVVNNLLGQDCVLDSGSAFAWSLKATGKSTFPRDGEFRSWQNAVSCLNTTVPMEEDEEGHRGFGSSFGLPHRDYSAAESLCQEVEEGKESPAILTVWIPLNDTTLDNGCMYVVPREFDVDFTRTDNYHAHMNPASEVQRGLSSKIRFPLHGVRALPAPAGSLLAWYGNTIHWGSACSHYAKVPRKSIALTFLRSDSNFSAKEASPITTTEASAMTPELRLALISRSLLLYNQWHALADDAVPPLICETTAIPEKRQPHILTRQTCPGEITH